MVPCDAGYTRNDRTIKFLPYFSHIAIIFRSPWRTIRQLGKVCLVGCHDLRVDESSRCGAIGDKKIAEGDWLSLDGDTGEVALGRRSIITELPAAELAEIDGWRRQ